MAKIVIPEDLKGKDLFEFLIQNKSELISQKKSIIKHSQSIVSVPDVFGKADGSFKSVSTGAVIEDPNSLFVKIVCNACWWMDSDRDVLIDNSAKRTIQQRKFLIPHLKDHIHQVDAQVGDVQDIYLADIELKKLGLRQSGTTQCIVMESAVKRDYHPRVFELYKAGKIQQHSIGMHYVKIELAINDEEYEKEKDFWNKYYDKILNKKEVDDSGFFWVVSEIKLLENSCVLFGANELTPTLEIGKSHSTGTGKSATPNDPDESNQEFSIDAAITTVKFFN